MDQPIDTITLKMTDGKPVITVVFLGKDPFTNQDTLRSEPIEVQAGSEQYKKLMTDVADSATSRALQAEGHLASMTKRAEDAEKALQSTAADIETLAGKLAAMQSTIDQNGREEAALRQENANLRVENQSLREQYGVEE